jgi:transcriptional regulator with XRE-family HTH domain
MRAFLGPLIKGIRNEIDHLRLRPGVATLPRGARLARRRRRGENDWVPSGTSRQKPRKPLIPKKREREALRKKVGAFLRERRQELGLTQAQITQSLGYVSLNSVSNLETGREGLPAKRIYAWADILQLPRDTFFRFVTGEAETMETGKASGAAAGEMTRTEAELLAAYRRLPAKYQRRLRAAAGEFETLARSETRKKKS